MDQELGSRPTALANNSYDYVTVQPFAGTTLGQDVSVISAWMDMQPNAVFILHTGWSGPNNYINDYLSSNISSARASDAYFDALEQALSIEYPSREIRRSRAAELLYSIAQDIGNNESPFGQLSELYRDEIHMSYGHGRYMMHNVMRFAVHQGLNLTPDEEADAERLYINAKLREVLMDETTLPGDFNYDGVVNLADYTMWRNHLGEETETPLGNHGDGFKGVDAGDYTAWKTHFGSSAAASVPSTNAVNVPEPAGLVLLGVLLGASNGLRRLVR